MTAQLTGRRRSQGMTHARSIVRQVCRIAGQITLVDDLQDNAIATGLATAVANHDTAVIFDWLIREVRPRDFRRRG